MINMIKKVIEKMVKFMLLVFAGPVIVKGAIVALALISFLEDES